MSTVKITLEQLNQELAEGRRPAEIIKKYGITERTFYRRRKELSEKGVQIKVVKETESLTVMEEHKLKRQLKNQQDECKELKAQVEAEQRRAAMMEYFSQANYVPPEWVVSSSPANKSAVAVAMLSDTHYDEVVNPDEINNVNAYNRAIAGQRTERFFQNVIRIDRDYIAGVKTEGLVLCLGGDMVSGAIHDELAQSNEAHIMDTVDYFTGVLIAGIELVLSHFKKLLIPCVVGNHGRNTRKPRNKGRIKDNFDYMIYCNLARHFQGRKNIDFLIPDSADCKFNIYNTRFCLTHGDQFRGGNGIAGIFSPIMRGDYKKRTRETSINQPYDVLMMGHWHQLKDMGSIVINGSLKGYDEYAYNSNFDFEPPQQAFFIVTPEHGKGAFFPVRVDDTKYYGQNPVAFQGAA